LQYNHRQEFDIRRGDRSSIPALDLKLLNHTIEIKRNYEGDQMHCKTGIQLRYTDNYNNYETGVLPLIPDYREGNAGIFTSITFPGEKISWNAGGRYDLRLLHAWSITMQSPFNIVLQDRLNHEGALAIGLKFTPGEHFSTRLHLVGARRSPAPNELYSFGLHQGIAGIEEGDWSLKPETSIKAIVDQKISLPPLAHVFITAFAHSVVDFIYLQPEPELRLTIRGAFPVYRYAQDDALIRGLDLLVVSDFSHRLEWTGKVSFIRGTRTADKSNLTSMPPAQFRSSVSWSVKDSRRWKTVKLHVDASYTAEQHHWDEGAELVAPPEDYWLLNMGFSAGMVMGEKIIHGTVVVENLLNQRYRNYLNRLRYFADEEGVNVRLQFRYEF
jgi:iron complex outermembrane receptor protein